MQDADLMWLMWNEPQSQISEYLQLRQEFENVRLERGSLGESLELFRQLLNKQKSNIESAHH